MDNCRGCLSLSRYPGEAIYIGERELRVLDIDPEVGSVILRLGPKGCPRRVYYEGQIIAQDDCEIIIARIDRYRPQVRLAIRAPRHITILRSEVRRRIAGGCP